MVHCVDLAALRRLVLVLMSVSEYCRGRWRIMATLAPAPFAKML